MILFTSEILSEIFGLLLGIIFGVGLRLYGGLIPRRQGSDDLYCPSSP